MPGIHLLCNAHIDPVWLWEWEEGAASVLSTFRAAADFCEEFENFVFCHNEAMIYQWVEEYEPKLFARIQALVKAGKWRIIGGWYLQPDVNMPGGESIIRQMQLGRAYFYEKFGVTNTCAVSFDAFGHNRGLVQLLKKAGYNAYLFMRPSADALNLPADDFVWVGFDASEIMAHRLNNGYNSALGKAKDKIENWLRTYPGAERGLIAWGVGNHGGGPSRKDISDINDFIASHPEAGIRHSSPEEYFGALNGAPLEKVARSLVPHAVGCYTSQMRVKRAHRALESLLNTAERMLSHAAMAGLLAYPKDALDQAAKDLCMSEFHDILPGSCIQAAEAASLQLIAHGTEIAARLRARAFFALASGEKRAAAGTYPILAYNPFPYPLDATLECEFMLADQNWNDEFTDVTVYQAGEKLPSQLEKEQCNIPLDWRKRVVFRATLAPMQISRFDCVTNVLPAKPALPQLGARLAFANEDMRVEIDCATGLIVRYSVDGFEYLAEGGLRLIALADSVDPWGMRVDRFRDVRGAFALMTPEQTAHFAGVKSETLAPVRVIEDGDVRTVVEACFVYADSRALVTYTLPKSGRAFTVDVRVWLGEKDTMIKLSVPTRLTERYVGQAIFGTEELRTDGGEAVSQAFCAACGEGRALGVINDATYGSDFSGGEIRLSLVHGAGYAAHPIDERPIVPEDRFTARMDQGERRFRFVIEGGMEAERMQNLTREAQAVNEPPFALSFFPDGDGCMPTSAALIYTPGVQMSALRKSREGDGWIARLFECAGANETVAKMEFPLLGIRAEIPLSRFEVATLLLDPVARMATKVNLLS